MNSAPCINCFNVICELNIKKIIFSSTSDFEIHKTSEYHTDHVSHGNRFLKTLKL
jgi:deoxycytidylate deaminase